MAKNKNLHSAKKKKNDEFYTQLTDIEKELRHYKHHFRGKVILCNCDDPFSSNFFKYFAMNFNYLGLKKLISIHYLEGERSYKIEITEVNDENLDGAIDLQDVELLLKDRQDIVIQLEGDGDFRSDECIELLKEADIVVTNPPFSLFREYVAQLVEYNKKFLILGNLNAVTYKEIFPLLKDNRIWFGESIHSGDREFRIPNHYETKSPSLRIDEKGLRYVRVPAVRWFTNLDYENRPEQLVLYKKYTPEEYPHYDNYDAINVDKVVTIPYDYDGVMGVPISFMDKYCPEQFEIIGCSYSYGEPKGYHIEGKSFNVSVNNKQIYKRLFIKRKV